MGRAKSWSKVFKRAFVSWLSWVSLFIMIIIYFAEKLEKKIIGNHQNFYNLNNMENYIILLSYLAIGVIINFKLISLTERYKIKFWEKRNYKDADNMIFATLIAWPIVIFYIFHLIIKHYKKQ